MPSHDRLLQGGTIGQLAGSIVERGGLRGININPGIIGHCHSSSVDIGSKCC
jgi:hypothetical protein